MPKNAWHILKDDQSVTVTRRFPARFDVFAEAKLPRGNKLRVAHQVRQDLWRTLQNQKGFSPVVEVREEGGELSIRAGGQCDLQVARGMMEGRIADLLADASKRARWVRHAQRGGRSHA
jgi:hypothetical protein